MLKNQKKSIKSTRTRLIKGNHPSQLGGHIFKVINGTKYHFKSKPELIVFQKYYRLLNKYYYREKYSHQYVNAGVNRSYSADYLIKPEYKNSVKLNMILPDIIEVKGGNLFNYYRRSNEYLINYLKFKSAIELGLTILIIDVINDKILLHRINSTDDLNQLFKDYLDRIEDSL